MSFFKLSPQTGLYYEHHAPTDAKGATFVFFNALTGDTSAWEGAICPILRDAGHGTRVYNMRGQTDSPFEPDAELSEEQIVADAGQLLTALSPVRPILVGLSIGGLFASRVWLAGSQAIGLVLINTLRREGPRLKWIGDALVRAVEVGGLTLFRDLFLPLLMSEEWLQKNRPDFLQTNADYTALEPASGHYKLLAEAGRKADWNLPYEQLTLPTLVITGLQDHVFLEKDIVETLFARIPDGRRIDMPAAGHLIPSEQPEALADAFILFAKEIL
ncbi:MAG: alpha/beta fold hydrolase [Desulfobacterales bacterium]|jgi:pimeloyl-ACP methyl ester carboxylesterase